MRWFCWYFNYWKRCFLRRVTVILLQQKNFGPNVIYFALGITEGCPAGAFWADKVVFWAGKASRRTLLGGRSNFQTCFKSCFDNRFRIYAKIDEDSTKNRWFSFYAELWPEQVLHRILVPMSYITYLDISWLQIVYYKKMTVANPRRSFFAKCFDNVLILKKDTSRWADFAGSFIIEKGASCVELRSFYCSKRMLVPMSYIAWLYDHRNQTH